MPQRSPGVKAVIDTNVFVGNQMTHNPHSPNRRVIRWWLVERHLKLAVSDDIFIATAIAAKADYLITNDRDLLEISEADKHKLKFQIVTPQEFLKQWEQLQ